MGTSITFKPTNQKPMANHDNIQQSKGYVILFGNQMQGFECNDFQEAKERWKRFSKGSASYLGDLEMYYDGVIIRRLGNIDATLLGCECHPMRVAPTEFLHRVYTKYKNGVKVDCTYERSMKRDAESVTV